MIWFKRSYTGGVRGYLMADVLGINDCTWKLDTKRLQVETSKSTLLLREAADRFCVPAAPCFAIDTLL